MMQTKQMKIGGMTLIEKTKYKISLLTTLTILGLSFIGTYYNGLLIILSFVCMLVCIYLAAWSAELEQKEKCFD